ncbi:O-antigen ligase family protein [Archangium violaceum]|uniref:O-antigen ligase family protein n=1 Tax=Archangium violaceum TaxID=83451 RepID=UPI00193B18D2|nr:O-antigen ligase family protein [Archangium violaceum]QRK09527.1 O-antigen ligase family protein [Archangium violaceum]
MGMGSKAVQSQDRWAFGFLLAFLAAIYVSPGEWIPGLERWRPALLTSAAATGLMLLGRMGRREPLWVDGQRGVLLITFCGLVFASLGWSLYPDATRFAAVELLKWVLVYLTLVNLVTSERRLHLVCLALVMGSLVTSHGVIAWHNAGVDMVEGYRARWIGVYADPNRMAMSVGIIVPLAVAFFVRKQSPWLLRLACGVAAAMAITAMVFSYSRGGFLGLVTAAATWVLLERRLARTLVVVAVAGAMLVLSPESFWTRTRSVSSYEEDASAMSRVQAWTVASRVSLEHPLLGVGAGTFPYAWRLYGPQESRAYAAHNIFLQVISDLGFLGLGLFLAFIGSALGPLWTLARDRERGWLARAIAAAVVGHLVSCLFAGFLVAVHFYVLFGLAACAERLARAKQPAPAEGSSGLSPVMPSSRENPSAWEAANTASGHISGQQR